MSFYKEVPGRQTTLESTLKFDTTPTEGSTNPVTSDGVKSAIDGAVGDAAAALQDQIDDIAEKAGSGYIPKGEAAVATLNALSGQENGDLYTMTDAGTLTLGSLAVVAGDTVAWDATNSVWYKAMDYAPRQYGTNEVHNLPTTITAFRTGDVIPVDGPSGTAKMLKDDLLRVTAENSLGSIHLLSDTATEADLVAGNYLAIDGSAGKKKLPANLVPSATSVQKDRLLFYLTSNTALQVDGYYNENSGKIWIKYAGDLAVRGKVLNTSKNRSVNLASLASELGVSLEISAGGMENSLPIATEQTLVYAPSSGTFSLKEIENVVDTDVVILANRGGLVLCGCDLISIQYNQKIFESKNRLQIYCASSTPPYIEQTSTSGGALYFNCNSLLARGSVSSGWTMAQIASEVGVSLVTSPKGHTNCLQIPNVYNLVLTYYGKLVLRDRTKVRPTDYIILANVDGVAVINNIGQYQSKKIESLEDSVTSLDARLTSVEPNATIGGIDEYSATNDAFADSVKSVVGDSDTILFFSDPHCMGTDDTYTASFVTHTKMLVSALSAFAKTNSISKVICGGDFLRAGDTQFNAIKKIGYFTSLLKKLVGCIFALGNHDNNSQGKLDAESAPNTGLLTHAQQIASEFVEQGSIYYKSEGAKTDYYILDTGSSPTIEMNTYRWEQIDWIANELLSAKKPHGVVVMHIYSDGLSSDQWSSKITDFSANLQTLLGALNSRSSVTLNGHTYDFSDAVTKVSVILCGHTHYDYVDTTGNVPVVAITQTFPTYNSTTYSIDAIVLDYGAGEMRCTRLGGEGSDRTITIVA